MVISCQVCIETKDRVMKKIIAMVAFSAIAATSIASAADMPVKAYRAPTPIADWSGFYIGVNGGYGWADQNDWELGGGVIGQGKINGGFGGGQVGYNWQVNTLLFGVQADGDWGNIRGSARLPLGLSPDGRCFSGGDQTADCSTTYSGMVNLTARMGYLVTPSTLIYGKAGINWSALDFKVNNVIDITGGTCGPIGTNRGGYATQTEWRSGVTAGLGVEQRVYDHFTVFGEYDVVDNGGSTINNFTGGTGTGGCTANFSAKTTTRALNIFKVGVNYQFH
jgi:outer membrane immunogenic protein